MKRLFLALLSTGLGLLHCATATAANPVAFQYGSTTNASLYAHPTGMIVTGRCNRYANEFMNARAAGAEVLVYLDPVERPNSPVCAMDEGFYMGNSSSVPLWGKDANNNWRVNYSGHTMTDIRAGSTWSDHVVSYVEQLMQDDQIDGVFLDVVGARLWSGLANWSSWSSAERNAWTEGNVDLVRRLDVLRRQINPNFIIVTNNTWDTNGTVGLPGEQYVSGVCLEHPAGSPTTVNYHTNYAGRAFSNIGHRRVIVIADNDAEAAQWAAVAGVTHVTGQPSYANAGSPPVGFTRLTDRPLTFGRTTVATVPSAGMTADRKRASKFVLSELGTLLRFRAYLDGQGGGTGSQAVKVVLYRDNAGLPGAKVAESSQVNVSAGTAAAWINFPATATRLDPGTYWVALFTGTTATIARNFGDGANNWYGNTDTYSDGAANPFGAGNTGTGTMSLQVIYTRGN
jgi:hypothetical protein